jgi:beta-lactamase superfamily II metal-dependent hydrolase
VTYVPGGKGEEGNDNDLSLVAALTSGNDSYLFTGDLQKDGIEAYLEHSLGQFDVLKVPHH